MASEHNAVLNRIMLSIDSISADVQESKQPVPGKLQELLESLTHHLMSQPESNLQNKVSETLDLLETCKWDRPTRLQGCLAELKLVAAHAVKRLLDPSHQKTLLNRDLLSIDSILADVQESTQPVPGKLHELLECLKHHLLSQPERSLHNKIAETEKLLSTCKWERSTRLSGCIAEMQLVKALALKEEDSCETNHHVNTRAGETSTANEVLDAFLQRFEPCIRMAYCTVGSMEETLISRATTGDLNVEFVKKLLEAKSALHQCYFEAGACDITSSGSPAEALAVWGDKDPRFAQLQSEVKQRIDKRVEEGFKPVLARVAGKRKRKPESVARSAF